MPTDEAAPSEPGNTSESDADKDQGENEEAGPEGVTALLPKSICPGMDLQPGQNITLKVLKSYEDEIEVEYVKGDQGESEMDRSEGKLTAMAEEPLA
jgi:hypothetical protein